MADDAGGNLQPKLFSARESSLKVTPGGVIPGLQSLEYKVDKSIINVNSVGSDTKTGVDYGAKVITGKIVVKSACTDLDKLFYESDPDKAKFELTANLKKGTSNSRTVQFSDCHMIDRDFSIEINGVGSCVYSFSATEIKSDNT